MNDFTYCIDEDCPLAHLCARQQEPTEEYVTFFAESPRVEKYGKFDCEYFLGNEK